MKSLKFLSVAALLVLFISCSKDDDGGNNTDDLTISLGITGYKASFYQAGESGEVTVISNIGDATVDVAAGTDPAITYNDATSRVEWTQLLPLGDNVVTLVATVGMTEATTEITIENDFEGNFAGGNNNDATSTDVDNSLTSIVFDTDGENRTVAVTDDSGNNATGSWSLNEDNTVVTFVITYDEGATYFTYQGDVVYDEMGAYIAGMWYDGQTAEPGTEQGYFRIDFQ